MDNLESVMAEALAEKRSVGAADQLKADRQFVDAYLSGDKSAATRMSTAIQQDLGTPTTDTQHQDAPAPFAFNFGDLAQRMTMEELTEANAEIQHVVDKFKMPQHLVQSFFDRAIQLSSKYAQDPEADLEERLGSLQSELRRQWGEDYDARYKKLADTLNSMPWLDDFAYNTGAWSDPWFMSTLSRVVEGDLW